MKTVFRHSSQKPCDPNDMRGNCTAQRKKTKQRIKGLAILAAGLTAAVCVWFGLRAAAAVSCTPYAGRIEPAAYGEEETVIKAVSLCCLTYGCDGCDSLSGTVAAQLDQHEMGIFRENYGLKRADATDPSTAAFDTSAFIRENVGGFRYLDSLRDSSSGFFGVAFCDDERKCVWISYSGAVTWKDAAACAGLVLAPGLTAQEKSAVAFYETVMKSDEVARRSYSVILTGHSLGGALAAMVSRLSGCPAVTINGADGLALDKINGIVGEKPSEYRITNYLTSPNNKKLSAMDLVQRFMFWGSDKVLTNHVFRENGLTTDTHSVFSFLAFRDGDVSAPYLPEPMEEQTD